MSDCRLAYRYRLYPTKAQETLLKETLETCRLVYNSLLNWRKHDYEVLGKSPSKFAQQAAFPKWKKEHPELCNVYSQVLQNVAARVDLAFDAFFRRVRSGETPGLPRRKGEGYDSFTYPQSGFGFQQGRLRLSRIGDVAVRLHRPIDGTIKACTIRRVRHKWYACFSCEVGPELLPASEEQVGIDVGLKTFAALSNGEMIENPRFFRKDERALAKAQRKLSKQKRGSRERRKAKQVVSRIHERVRHRRHDFVHQTVRRIVNRFGVIVVEKLNVKGMVQNHCLAKSISDASWSMFRNVLSQKAERAARVYAEINPAYTSMTCSGCGHIAKKPLSQRQHDCPMCGLSLDRDTNAAINILSVGQYRVAA
ncbi:MAG: transposase [Armatimonadetes bacterium]|nr:transposase [Armatimonadota bacterium]